MAKKSDKKAQTELLEELRERFLKAWDEGHKIIQEGPEKALVGAGTTGWTSDTGALSSLTTADVPGLTPYAGNRFFSSSATDTSASQELSAGDVQLVAGAKFTVTWQQARGPAGSLARMGVQFLDQDDAVITTAYADWAAANDLYTWEERTLTAVAPRGTARVRLLQEYDLVGTGTTDAYIDAITMVAGGVSISWDGSSLDDWTTSPSTTAAAMLAHLPTEPLPRYVAAKVDGTV